MNTSERRWWDACLFLSLDILQPYQKSLWLEFFDFNKHQQLVQGIILPLIQKGEHPTTNRLYNTAILLKKTKEYNQDCFYQLSWWIRNVFLSGGLDRSSEMFWSSIAMNTFHRKISEGESTWINESMCEVAQAYIEASRNISDIVMTVVINSEWDSQVLYIQENSIDNIRTKLELILCYNAFVDIWDKIIGDLDYSRMLELYIYGVRLAEETMKGIQLNFPGSWKLELDEYRKTIINV